MNLHKILRIARSSHTATPFFSGQRHLGVVLATLGWCTLSAVLTLLPNTTPLFEGSGTVNLFFFHLSITITFFLFGLPYGSSFFTCNKPKLVVFRGLLAEISLFVFIFSKVWSPETNRSLLYTIDPIWAAITILLTKCKITKLSWTGIFTSVIGVCVIYYTSEHIWGDFKTFSSGIFSGALITINILVLHSLIKTEHTSRIGFYQGIIGSVFSIGILIFHSSVGAFQFPPIEEMIISLFFGIAYSFALFCFIQSAFYIEAFVIRITSYSLIFFTEFMKWAITKELIPTPSIIGIALIIFGGVKVVLGTFAPEEKKYMN
ncbi:MAG: hypothetical protein ChlgKO_03910 [Chlamydiales bacterium]